MQDQISEVEWNFFLTGGKHLVCSDDNPTTWLPDNAWMAICNLVTLPIFDELKTNINTRSDIWKQFYENEVRLIIYSLRPHSLNSSVHAYLLDIQMTARTTWTEVTELFQPNSVTWELL